MMSGTTVAGDVPRAPLVAIAAFLGATLLAVGVARVAGYEPVRKPEAPVVTHHDLHFADLPGGIVEVTENGAQVALLTGGTDGFVRVVMRSLTRDRRLHGLGREEPFRLRIHADGRLSLEDRATQRVVDLAGFGVDNIAAFRRLVPQQEATP
jgi:putative photosynthetic complex assembly protein